MLGEQRGETLARPNAPTRDNHQLMFADQTLCMSNNRIEDIGVLGLPFG